MRCRGRAVPSRRCTDDSYWVSIKTHKPIASVAALTAQPLSALPPYGCGVPLAGSERLWQLQVSRHFRRAYRLSSLSLRGGRRPTWQSRSTRLHRGKVTGEIVTAFPRLPRLLRSLAMTNLAPCCIRRDAVTSLQAPSSRVIAGREAPLALPLGELSPKVTERALQALPIGSGHR